MQGSFGVPKVPDYKALGYQCSSSQVRGTWSLGYGGGSPFCLTIYYLDATSGLLQAFRTASPNFKTTRGTTVGVDSATAQQREGQQVVVGCRDGIQLGDNNAPASVFIEILGGPGSSSAPTDTVFDLQAEASSSTGDVGGVGGVGLMFC